MRVYTAVVDSKIMTGIARRFVAHSTDFLGPSKVTSPMFLLNGIFPTLKNDEKKIFISPNVR